MARRRVSLAKAYLSNRNEKVPTGEFGNLPPTLKAVLKAGQELPPQKDYGPEYELLQPHFDYAHYLGSFPDILRSKLDPLSHYLRAGANAGRDPAPFFSGASYLEKVPEAQNSDLSPFGHWLSNGAKDPHLYATKTDFEAVARVMGQDASSLLDFLNNRTFDIRTRLASGLLGEMVSKAVSHEPLIEQVWARALTPRLLPFSNSNVLGRIVTLHTLQEAAGWERARIVLVVPRVDGGAAGRDAMFVRALCALVPESDILVLCLNDTEPELRAQTPSPWPNGVRALALPALAHDLSQDNFQRVLVEFLRSLKPEVSVFVASNMTWDFLSAYARQLSDVMSLAVWLQDYDVAEDVVLSGHFYRNFGLLSGVLLPAAEMREALACRFHLPDEEAGSMHILPPTSLPVEYKPQQSDQKAKVLAIAPRIDSESTDRLMTIAASYGDDVEFVLMINEDRKIRRYGYYPGNVSIVRADTVAGHAHLETGDIWLNCSDGAFLETIQYAAAKGLAVVATTEACRAAGVPPDLCWCPSEDETSGRDFVGALSAALENPIERQMRSKNLAKEYRDGRDNTDTLSRMISPLLRIEGGDWKKADVTPTAAVEKATDIELTIALTSHAETYEAGPMFASLKAAINECYKFGIRCELVVGFDKSSEENKKFFNNSLRKHFQGVKCFNYSFGDQGKTRNALVSEAKGEFLAIVDADDLVSENWFVNATLKLRKQAAQNVNAIIHPELNFQFDGVIQAYSNPDQCSPLFSPHVMAIANYYDAMCVAPTQLWRQLPYADRDLESGFALEDYQWFVEATALGWRHEIAPDTIVFKRRRDASQHRNSLKEKALIRAIEPLAINKIRGLGQAC